MPDERQLYENARIRSYSRGSELSAYHRGDFTEARVLLATSALIALVDVTNVDPARHGDVCLDLIHVLRWGRPNDPFLDRVAQCVAKFLKESQG
jgi:phage-related baseplate assembly protein